VKKANGNLPISKLLSLSLALLMHLSLSAAEPSPAKPAPAKPSDKDQAAELLALFQSKENTTNSLNSVMVWIPSGIRVGKTEITQAQYQTVMGNNPSHFSGGNRPVETVSPTEAKQFCERLTRQERDAGTIPPGYSYGLPSQLEFDTCIQDTPLNTAYVSLIGDRPSTIAVGSFAPNSLGLHDIRGNVWEWCHDQVARGGSYQSHEDYLSPSFRFVGAPDMKVMDIGFRVVLRANN
jgi:formylglycine-generating enzyme required for sulfatase activity